MKGAVKKERRNSIKNKEIKVKEKREAVKDDRTDENSSFDIRKQISEIEEQIKKQQTDNKRIKKEKKKEEKLEDIILKEKTKEDSSGNSGAYFDIIKDVRIDYEYMFSYLGSGVRTGLSSEYVVDSSVKGELSARTWTDEIMDFREQEAYASRQAANFLLGTGMNHISYDEKLKFDALMTDPSNKIIFLINYEMIGMNWKMPERAPASSQYQEAKISNEEIMEKSMKNDPAISLRFDTKGKEVKEYIK